MFPETSVDDAFLPSNQDEEMVDNLLAGAESEVGGGGGSSVSLANALLPLVDSPCPSSVPWVCSTRYKTQLCTSYSVSGLCKYAERCQFAHGLSELHVPFHHPKYKTELCRSYHAGGHCYYGSRCLFVHSPSERRPAHNQQHRRRNVPCRTFRATGVCPFGTRCHFLHVDEAPPSKCVDPGEEEEVAGRPRPKVWTPRGALCRTFSAFGFCIYGTRCRFQHGLPAKVKRSESGSTGLPSPLAIGSPKSSLSSSPLATPSPEATANNAFTFSSQHLSDLLLPLALHLQQLEMSKAQVWGDHRAL